ncbi:MAG: hypothetical protein ABI467_22950 [Kofleriaceae bacterium]
MSERLAIVWFLLAGACGRIGFASESSGDSGVIDSDLATCPAFADFCDDFETGDLSRWDGMRIVGSGSVSVEPGAARDGRFGLHAQVPAPAAGNDEASIEVTRASPSSGTYAMREWIDPLTPIVNYTFVLSARDDQGAYAAVGGNSSGDWVASEAPPGGTPIGDHPSPEATVTPGNWVCAELDVIVGSPAGTSQIELYVGDALVVSSPMVDPMPAYTELFVGIPRAAPIGFEVRVDDVVIAHQHIGC